MIDKENYPYNGFSIDYRFCPYCGQKAFKELKRESSYDNYEAVCENCCAKYSKPVMEQGMEQQPQVYFHMPSTETELFDIIKRKLNISPGYNNIILDNKRLTNYTKHYNECTTAKEILKRTLQLIKDRKFTIRKITNRQSYIPDNANYILEFIDDAKACREVMVMYICYCENTVASNRIKIIQMSFNVLADNRQKDFLNNFAVDESNYLLFTEHQDFIFPIENGINTLEEK